MREVIYRRGGAHHSISLYSEKQLMQCFSVQDMDPEQRAETMALSIQWLNSRKYNLAKKPSKLDKIEPVIHQATDDVSLSERVAQFAETMTRNFQNREAQRAARRQQSREAAQ